MVVIVVIDLSFQAYKNRAKIKIDYNKNKFVIFVFKKYNSFYPLTNFDVLSSA